VLDAGKTVVLPEEAKVPIPWSIVTDVAPDTLQLRVIELPAVMVFGLAKK
jgi:hypothetical protein